MAVQDQLLVLGNGFDLQCGLKSAFADFMKPREALIKQIHESPESNKIPRYINLKGPDGRPLDRNLLSSLLWYKRLTVWDFILAQGKQEQPWYDIEACIKTWVDYGAAGEDSSCAEHMRKIYSHRGETIEDFQQPLLAEQSVYLYAQELYQVSPMGWSQESILHVLMAELNRFEVEFATYLVGQTENNSEYLQRSRQLLTMLILDNLDWFIEPKVHRLNTHHLESVGILDFNYTDPAPLYGNDTPPILNVHGLAKDKNIIFGIDGKNLNPNQLHYASTVKFTKTYRLMALSNKPHHSLVRPYIAGSPDGATKVIKFFGHSLSDADYSYFQAIFDAVKLQKSNTRLIFYYNQNRPDGTTAQEEMREKVNRLITTYSATLDNDDHGRNLLHKLLLEGRLIIKHAPILDN
nr:AbiH family protein [Bifidobacterium indicum]